MPTATKATTTNFVDADAYKTWRVIAPVPSYTSTTEGFGFSNGQAVVAALPKSVKCPGGCGVDGDLCRLHERVFHLNNLRNYPTFTRVRDASTGKRRTVKGEGYRVLSEEEYEREFSESDASDVIDLDDF
jgi:hypothetical protein